MLYFPLCLLILSLSTAWAQECPNLQFCIVAAMSECPEVDSQNVGDREGRDREDHDKDGRHRGGREGKYEVMQCIKTKLTEANFDFEQFEIDNPRDENRCDHRMAFEACGIESRTFGGRRGAGRRGPGGRGPSDGSQPSRRGPRGRFGPRDNDDVDQEDRENRRSRGGSHEHFSFLKGCRAEFGDDSRGPPTEGKRCRKHAVRECLKENREEIQQKLSCTLPDEDERQCNAYVARAIQACKPEQFNN